MDGFKRLCLLVFITVDIVIFGCPTKANGQNEALEKGSEDINQTFEQGEDFYEWSVWSPCSRSCGIGVKFRGQLCLRRNKALCVKKPTIYETCNPQACPPGGTSFRDLQCGIYNDRNIFINGHKAKWLSYVRGDNQCLLFCYPQGGQLFYYFGKAKDGTQCSKEPRGVCIRGRCKPVGCDNVLESGVYLDKCRVCGGNSTTCEPVRGRIERSLNHFEKMSGYAEVMVIPKGSTSVFLSDETWNYLAIKRKNGDYVFNGDRIASWSGFYKIGDVDVQYTKFSNNVKETIQIPGPTEEDIYVMCLLITGKLNISFEYWIPIKDTKVLQEAAEVKTYLQGNRLDLLIEWGRWTACSATCGGGIKVRARKRGNGDVSSFLGGETDVQRCGDVPCDEMMSEWSEWGPWDDCSASCGGGARMRFRYCKTPNQSTDRSSCLGDRYAVELCNAQECPTEGVNVAGKMANTSDIINVETPSLLQETPAVNSTGTSYEIYPSPSITPKDNLSDSHKIARTTPFSTSFFDVSQSTPSSLTGYTLTSPEIFHFLANSSFVSTIKASRTTHGSYFSVTEQMIPVSSDHDQSAAPFSSSDVRKISTSGLIKILDSAERGHTLARTPILPSYKLSATEANVLVVRPSISKWLSLPTDPTEMVSKMTTNAHSIVLGSSERSQAITFGGSIFPLFVTHSIIPRPKEKLASSSILNENASSSRKAFEVTPMSERHTIQRSNFVSLSVKRAASYYLSSSRNALSTTDYTNMAASETSFVTNAPVTTPVSSQEKMMSLNDSLLSNAEQSTTLKPQTGSSIFDINSRHPVMSTNSFSRQFKATESSKHLGKISSKLIMTRSARTPPSTALTSFEGSSGPVGSAPSSPEETQVFLLNVRTRSFLPPMEKTRPQTSFSIGTMLFFEPNDVRSGRVLLKNASKSSGLSSFLDPSGHNITPRSFPSTKQDVDNTRKTAELAVEGEGLWRGTIVLSSKINTLTKYFHASKGQDINTKSTKIISEGIIAVKSVRPTKTTIPFEITKKLIIVWPPTPSIALSTSERWKSSTGYSHGRLSRSVFPTIVSGLPKEALTKSTYSFEREISSRPSPSFQLLPTLSKIPTPLDEAKLLLPSPSINLSSTGTGFSLSKEEPPSSITTKDTLIMYSKNRSSTLHLAHPSSAIEEGPLLQSAILTSVLRNQPVLSSPYPQFNSTPREVRTNMPSKDISSSIVPVTTSLSSSTPLAPKEEGSITRKDSGVLRNSVMKQNLVNNETDSFNSSLFRKRVSSSITKSTQVMKGKETSKIEWLTRSSSSQNVLSSWYRAPTGTLKDDFKATEIYSFIRPLPGQAIISSTKMQFRSTQSELESESVATSLSRTNIPMSASKNSTFEATVLFSPSIPSEIHFNLPLSSKMPSKQKGEAIEPTLSSFSGPSSLESIRPSSYSAVNEEALPRHNEYVTIASFRRCTPPVTEGVFTYSVLSLKSMSTRKHKQLSTAANFSNLTPIPNEFTTSLLGHPSLLSSQRYPLSSKSIEYLRSLSVPSQKELSPNPPSPNKTTREYDKTLIAPTVSTEFSSFEHSAVSQTLKDVRPFFSSVKRREAVAESLDFSLGSGSSQSSLDLKFPPIQRSSSSDFESSTASLSRLPKVPMNTNSSPSAKEQVTSSSPLTKRMQISVSRNLNSSTNADHVKQTVLDKKTPPWQAISPALTQFSSIEVDKVTMSYMAPFTTSLPQLTPSSMYAQLILTREQSRSTGKDYVTRLMSSQPTQTLTSSGVRPASKMITSVSQQDKIFTFEYFNSRPAYESSTNNVNSIASSSAGVSFSLAMPVIFSSDETTNTWVLRQSKTAPKRLIMMNMTSLISAAIGENTVSRNVVSLTSHPILSSKSSQFRLGAIQPTRITISPEAPVNPTSKQITPSLTSLPIKGNLASLVINLTNTSSLKSMVSSTYLRTILSSKKGNATAIISPEGSLMSKDEHFTAERSSIRNSSVLYMESYTSKSLVSFSRSLDSNIVNQPFTATLTRQISTRKKSKHELMLKTSSSIPRFTNGKPSPSSLVKDDVASSPILEESSRLVAHTVKPTKMNEAPVSANTIRHEEKHRCDPCVNQIKLTRAYCISDFVVHVRILTEGINELSLDTNYRIGIINIFKMNSSLPTFRSVWILSNLCSCPLIRPGKQYLLTGKMTRLAGSTKIIAEVSRESYVQEWTTSMLTRMEEIKSKRCSLIKATWMTTSVGTKPEGTSGPTKRPARFTSERTTKCLPCDLGQRLREKYCGSDYAIIVRIRSQEIVDGNHTLYLVNVKKVFKKNQRMKKKLDIRFNNKTCDCKPKLSFKREYLVIGNHNVTIRKMASLELDRQSFLAEWDETLENEMNQMADSCLRNSVVVTPRLANSLQIITGIKTSATFKISAPTGKYATISSPAAASPPVTVTHNYTTKLSVTASTAGSRCDPCVNQMKRARAYCISDFVVHVRILSEGINELSLDTNYRVRFIHMFKMNSSLPTFRSVWILSNLCSCPLLLPGKQYLLMGKMTRMVGSTKVISEVGRESYVEEWNESLLRRIQDLRKRCQLMKTTQTTTLVRAEPKTIAGPPEEKFLITSQGITEIGRESPTTLSTPNRPEKCRTCRISKKRNKSYCESDFVIRARILQSTFDNRTQERRYLVRVITVFRSLVDLKTRQEIFVQGDYCQCPRLFLRKQYVIMGTAEQISELRLLIPQRPFVRIWQTNMKARLKSIGDICDD